MNSRLTAAILWTTLAVAMLAVTGCGPASDVATESSASSPDRATPPSTATDATSATTAGTGEAAMASASAAASVSPLQPGEIPTSCTRYDDRPLISAMAGGTLSAPEFIDPASHPMPQTEAAYNQAVDANTIPGLTCTWGTDEQLVTVLLEVHPDTSPWFTRASTGACTAGQPGQRVTVTEGLTGIYCDGHGGGIAESVSFAAHGRVYNAARTKTQNGRSYQTMLLQYAAHLVPVG